MSENFRQSKRASGTAYIDYTGTEVLMFQQIIDISEGGVRIIATREEKINTEVFVDLHFPELGHKEAYAEGIVVWVEAGKLGIKFTKISPEDRKVIQEFVVFQEKQKG